MTLNCLRSNCSYKHAFKITVLFISPEMSVNSYCSFEEKVLETMFKEEIKLKKNAVSYKL